MQPWALLVLVLCAVLITLVLVPALLAVRRSAERAERLLATAETELGPLLGQLQGLAEELRMFSKEARSELARLGVLAERAEEVTEGIGRVLAAVAGLTRAGQLVGMVAGIKAGLDVFLHRLRKPSGENNE